ncbi:Oligosaccharide translocation protein rft1 [Podochytrium sp. JEL0797]|nr:Oligosaccharide translocation protein rft1 [Podochytrium sp. JEL0797]
MSSFVKGAGQLMALNVWSRLLTFTLNQLALRFITRTVLGIVGMEMELLLASVLFLARECIRMALLRSVSTLPAGTRTLSRSQYINHQRLVNLAYIPIVLGITIVSSFLAYYTLYSPPSAPYMMRAIQVFLLSALVELVSEPFYVLGVNNLYFTVRVRIEAVAVFLKCVVAIGLLSISSHGEPGGVANEGAGVMAFAWSQMAYAGVLAVGYVTVFLITYRDVCVVGGDGKKGEFPQGIALLIPRMIDETDEGDDNDKRTKGSYFVDPVLSGLAWTFAKQGVFKHFLTEGDKILSVAFITTAIQGDYSLVEKYGEWSPASFDFQMSAYKSRFPGSIIARLLFQPIEEMSRVFFSKTLTADTSAPSSKTTPPNKQSILKSLTLLTLLLRLYILLSFYFLFFATNYTHLLIDLLASRQFSTGSAPHVFNAYCLYIPLLAINGVTEAFLQSIAPTAVLMQQSAWMGVCWVVFFVVGVVGIKGLGWGGVAVVAANSVNMAMRVWFSWSFVRTYFEGMLKQEGENETGRKLRSRKSDETEREEKEFRETVKRMLNPLELLPKSLTVWAAFGAAWAVTHASNDIIGWETMRAKMQHIGVGIVMFLIVTGFT